MSTHNLEFPADQIDLHLKVLRKAMDITPSMIYVINAESLQMVYANTPLRNHLGYSDEELAGLYENPSRFVHQDDLPELNAKVSDLFNRSTSSKTSLIYRVRHKNGAWKTLRDTLNLVSISHDDREPLRYIVGVAHDVTEQIALRDQLERFFEMSHDLLAIWTFDGELVRISPSFLNTLGLTEEEYRSLDPFALIHPSDLPLALKAREELLNGQIVTGLETRLRTKSGEYRDIHWHLVPDQERRLSFTVARDITEKKKNDVKLIHSSKLAALGEMAGGLAHEINNPLAIIAGRLALMKESIRRDSYSPERLLNQIDKLDSTLQRISKIIISLRAFARSSDDESFTRIPMARLVHETLDLCQERFKHAGVHLEVSPIPDIDVSSRGIQLSQVLLNLLNNAFDAVHGRPFPRIELTISAKPETICISVLDNGPGLPPEISDRIMEPFFTTKGVGKGTGLGLSVSKGIVEDHGGSLYLDRNSEQARFIIELPRH